MFNQKSTIVNKIYALQPFKINCASPSITSHLVLLLWQTVKIGPLGHVRKIYVTMLWAFQELKGMYPNHVTCIAHELCRICESIRENDNSVNNFIAALKKILVKPPSFIQSDWAPPSAVSCHHKVGYLDKMLQVLA